ncbi:glutamate 5-kinase [Tunicatimonas pelagia]|uniref:glutamate 5-kinase n=1 Tax=Tunicatimonas pelagia TaxID=931531 RepID=UPI00266554C5|nr:glutamate 5-kinase [Tunicatimonas pelagia]WKN40904.1 glutamate 5-kinase [Tunicatimonas pelagia]
MDRPVLIVKIGSNVIARPNGSLNTFLLRTLVKQMADLRQSGYDVLLVSSGAVTAGRQQVTDGQKTDPVTQRQVLAAVGQAQLMQLYRDLFGEHNTTCAQILVTKEDFRSRRHYLNIRNCLDGILRHQVLPIVNENDVVSVTELMFTDNDELAGLLASMMGAQRLIILTNVDGIYDRPPNQVGARLITEVAPQQPLNALISAEKSDFGRGGMRTKSRIARKLADLGIGVYIVNGQAENALEKVIEGQKVGTHFLPNRKVSPVKRWIGQAENAQQGSVHVNDGAYRALTQQEQANSLLLVGVIKIEGEFSKGEVVQLKYQGNVIGLGKSYYASSQAQTLVGQSDKKPIIHYDHLYLSGL